MLHLFCLFNTPIHFFYVWLFDLKFYNHKKFENVSYLSLTFSCRSSYLSYLLQSLESVLGDEKIKLMTTFTYNLISYMKKSISKKKYKIVVHCIKTRTSSSCSVCIKIRFIIKGRIHILCHENIHHIIYTIFHSTIPNHNFL